MNKKALSVYIFSMFLFGTNGIVASFILLSSYEIVLFRTLLGTLSLAAIFLIRGGKFHIREYKKDFLYNFLSGIAMGSSWMCLYEAYARMGVSIAVLIYYCGPVIVMMLSPLFFNEKLHLRTVFGFLTVLVGVIFINGIAASDRVNAGGVLCSVGAALFYSSLVILNKKCKNITGLENSVIQLFAAFVVVAAFVGLKQGYSIKVVPSQWWLIILLGVVNTGLNCYMYFATIAKLPVQSVAIFSYIEPLSAVVFAALILGERMNAAQILGALLIIGGAIFAELAKPKKEI